MVSCTALGALPAGQRSWSFAWRFLYTILCSELPSTREPYVLDRVQQRAMKIIRGLKHLSLQDGLSKRRCFSLENRGLRKHLINVWKGLNLRRMLQRRWSPALSSSVLWQKRECWRADWVCFWVSGSNCLCWTRKLWRDDIQRFLPRSTYVWFCEGI